MAAMRLAVLVDHYPGLSETFVLAEIASLGALGHEVTVETAAWAEPAASDPPAVAVHCIDDDPLARRLAALAWLLLHHPLGCTRDLVDRRRWRREEVVRPLRVIAPVVRRIRARRTDHLHAHFAAGAALDALRIGRLLGLPYSVTAHAYDIYRQPRNLAEKLRGAAVATGVCEYSVRDLRALAGPAANVHVVKMGVDHTRFLRDAPLPGGRAVVAVGRLVEKKGFRHLLDAAARLRDQGKLARLVVVGDGPLREQLQRHATQLGLNGIVEWRGAQDADGVQRALAEADVLAIPAVQAPDGDRDMLPLVAGEALAMEVPVVASDFVGLPEVVQKPWGRLVPPGDAEALAAALAEILDLDPPSRAAAGRAGRNFVVRTRDQLAEAQRLIRLITEAQITGVR